MPLTKLGFRVIAADASVEMLSKLHDHPEWREIDRIINTDGLNLTDVVTDPVDAIVCRAVLIHHSHKDVERLVEQFAKVLKTGGVLIADWPVGAHYERQNWTDVTTWRDKYRTRVAEAAGFEMLHPGTDAHGAPSVWRKS